MLGDREGEFYINMTSKIDRSETSCANNDRSGAVVFLEAWSQANPSPCAPPYNSQEVFSVYSQAMGCSFEDALKLAAQALLTQWRIENQTVQGEADPIRPYDDTELRALIRDKVQFNVGKLPRFVSDIYEAQAQAEGMNKREYFYHLLREKGGEIPPYASMDARKL